jgi:lysophospholipase L1-like esterase
LEGKPRPGLVTDKLDFTPLSQDLISLSERDIVICQCLGNELIEKHITKVGGHFRLDRFVPKTDAQVEQSYFILHSFLRFARAKVYIIDNPYRHLRGPQGQFCPPGLHGYWAKRNKELVDRFPLYSVYNHRHLMGYGIKKLQNKNFYSDLQIDGVHFRTEVYNRIAISLKNWIENQSENFLSELRGPHN